MSEHTPAPYRPRSVYGFALYVGSYIHFILYLIWVLAPQEFLRDKLNMDYLPTKYWAVAVPVWAMTACATFAFVVYPAINMHMTPNSDDIRTIRDQYSLESIQRIPGSVPPVSDIPITQVCRKMYLPLKRDNKNS